ncbi:ribonuclease kappa-B [Drosophila takahashii]|uniref:ribonuclease kappa-B n=1 Tax=Drosophila takahashii TaxID=29030 RepID=UPI001CF8874C|nr:ribonuclease kappa-B [Drosophila takahashii]
MVCGRKCCLFCLFMSCWAFVMLNLLGIFFYIRSLNLLESLPLPHHFNSRKEFQEQADAAYLEVSIRCFVAAVVYLGFIIISIVAIRRDIKKRKRLYKRGPLRPLR